MIKIIALGAIPQNRRPSSSLAWLLLIMVTPVFGLILFFLIGSPFVRGRRERVQAQANHVILEHTADLPPTNSELPIGMESMVRLSRRLTSLPMMTGTSHGLFGDYDASIAAMTAAVREAQRWVHVEIYIINIKLSGQIVSALDAVFALDWYTETGQRLPEEIIAPENYSVDQQPMQLLPSGPGYLTIPNLRLFTALVHRSQHRLSLTSPYFVPDESLLEAITTASYRGVAVELFVSELADQFVVQHAQASYYQELLNAGVRIYLYPKPTVLHAKFFTVDDVAGVIGSSNMDYRSFGLDYEISLMGTDPSFVADLQQISDDYRAACRELTAQEWTRRPRAKRYIDNVMRLLSALQ